ncbi:histone [uncultured Azohydromonas sp.]|uniref:histone n=1 Tax=uncultured Azohydromonas sp. TaxID=487342 RepID=UPI00261B8453|nr:histone [uncultured Azohydromonas sp.]
MAAATFRTKIDLASLAVGAKTVKQLARAVGKLAQTLSRMDESGAVRLEQPVRAKGAHLATTDAKAAKRFGMEEGRAPRGAKTAAPAAKKRAGATQAATTPAPAKKAAGKKAAAKKTRAQATPADEAPAAEAVDVTVTAKRAARKASAKKAPARKAAARKTRAQAAAADAVPKAEAADTAAPAAKKAAARKAPAKKAAGKKAPRRTSAASGSNEPVRAANEVSAVAPEAPPATDTPVAEATVS